MNNPRLSDNQYELVNCNLCGCAGFKEECFYGEIRIVRCNNCGLLYRNPRLKENMNRRFYGFDYYREYERMEERLYNARVGIFKKFFLKLEKEAPDTTRRLLDIGCGHGHFLKLAKDLGWQVTGVEPAGSACDYAKRNFNIEVTNKSIEEAGFEENYFDVITLWNVLDHLLDPLGVLIQLKRILKPGGLLVIRVPNANMHLLLHKIFLLLAHWIKDKGFRDPSVIVNYGFTNLAMRKMLKLAGFPYVRVCNSAASSGDPYRCFGGIKDQAISALKSLYYFFSQALYFLSFGRFLSGAALLVFVKK